MVHKTDKSLRHEIARRQEADRQLFRVNRALRMISLANQAMIRATEETALFQEICQVAVEVGEYPLAWIGLAQDDDGRTIRPVARAGPASAFPDEIHMSWADTELGRGPAGIAVRTGQPAVSTDLSTDPRYVPWRAQAARLGLASSIALPLIFAAQDRNPQDLAPAWQGFGVMAIYSATPRDFPDEEVTLLKELASDISYGIAVLRARVRREQADQARREGQDRLANVIESAMDAIITIDGAQRVVLFNQAAAKMFGCPAEQALNRPLEQFIPQRFRVAHGEHIRQFDQSGVTARQMGALGELAALRADGKEFPIEVSISQVTSFGGEKQFTAIVRDISDRKKSEARVKHLNAVLRSIQHINQIIIREQDLQVLLDQACASLTGTRGFQHAWIAILDDAGKLVATAQSGLDGQFEPIRQRLQQGVAGLPACARAAIKQSGAMVLPVSERVCGDCPMRGAMQNGQAVAVRLEHAGRVHGVLTVYAGQSLVVDREELVLLNELAGDIGLALHKLQIEGENKELQERYLRAQKMEAIGRLAGGIAHDFRNQLTVIGGFCDLLLRRIEPSSPLRGQLEEIRKAAQRSNVMVNQLLAFSRKQVLVPQSANFNDVLAEMAPSLAAMLGEDVELVLLPAADLSNVMVDTGQLQQAIMNVVANARDAMPAGGKLILETANVQIIESYAAAHPESTPGSFALLAISDTGEGMDDAVRQRIFEPYFTTKEKGKGTGLGLSMVYGFVKQSGGWINVYSEPGKGSTFRIHIPRVMHPSQAAEPQPAVQPHPTGQETILLAEDEPAVRGFICQVLEERGYTVLVAGNPAEALALAGRHEGKIDLLVSDVVMPGMSGPELAQRLSASRGGVKVLFISGYTNGAIAPQGVLGPGVHHLPKPFSPEALTQKVRQLLDG